MMARGRPKGQFDYNKLCVLKGLQEFSSVDRTPIRLSNDELCKFLQPWLEASPRALARYLLALQSEGMGGGKVPRIEIYYRRVRSSFKRMIIVNDMNAINL
jgi:hypothetical protein